MIFNILYKLVMSEPLILESKMEINKFKMEKRIIMLDKSAVVGISDALKTSVEIMNKRGQKITQKESDQNGMIVISLPEIEFAKLSISFAITDIQTAIEDVEGEKINYVHSLDKETLVEIALGNIQLSDLLKEVSALSILPSLESSLDNLKNSYNILDEAIKNSMTESEYLESIKVPEVVSTEEIVTEYDPNVESVQ